MPRHVWENVDPVTFKNSWNNGTGAIFSGPYVVKNFSSTEWDYKRNDNWWGARSGAFRLPAPLESTARGSVTVRPPNRRW